MDYARFRSEKQAKSEAVSVNHRALITRTLTKYPVDYALYRELLQNSADARATVATIQFESSEASDGLPASAIHTAPIQKLLFRNDGADFETDDWNRLREIARGNPNESKIGAFGVGFYSVFELTDEPLVHSGKSVMAFRFVGDQLNYSSNPEMPYVKGTVIDLPYRKEGRLPDLVKFIAFLCQSLMLVPLDRVELKLDSRLLFEFRKTSSPPTPLRFPERLEPRSPTKILKLAEMSSTPLKVELKYLNATQSPPPDLSSATGLLSFGKSLMSSLVTTSKDQAEYTEAVSFLHRIDATVDVSVSSSFRKSMQDTVMKPPPKRAHMSMLSYTRKDRESSSLGPPFTDYIFPPTFNDAKIFIGFPTRQSTGLKSHFALNQLIPTMERTAVDMSNSFVKDWNSQILAMAGIMARCVYESEMHTASLLPGVEEQLKAFTVNRFELETSAPDATVGRWIASGFWRASPVLLVPSQKGILPSTRARLPGNVPMSLLRDTPVISEAAMLKNPKFYEHAESIGYLTRVSPNELVQDLESAPLNLEQFKDLVHWAAKGSAPAFTADDLQRAVRSSVLSDPSGENGVIPLARIVFYQNTSVIPKEFPLPPTCLPSSVAYGLRTSEMEALRWKELDLLSYIRYLIENLASLDIVSNIVLNQSFAIDVLELLSRSWPRLADEVKHAIARQLQMVNCIPTQLGMKRPKETYMQRIPLFPDLPIVSSQLTASKVFLRGIEVRESVDMQFVLDVLHNPKSDLKWTSEDLVNYLVENQAKLQHSDWEILRTGPFFAADQPSVSLTRARTLFLPDKDLQKLGFPIFKWSGFSLTKDQTELLLKLGMRRSPALEELLSTAIARQLVPTGTRYFLANFTASGYSERAFRLLDLPVVPTASSRLARPSEVYVVPEAALFDFEVIAPAYVHESKKFGISTEPSMDSLLAFLFAHPPATMSDGDRLFGYLSLRADELTREHIATASVTKFIPIEPRQKIFDVPGNVFFEVGGDMPDGLFRVIKPAAKSRHFLSRVGVQTSPNWLQLADAVATDPTKVYGMLGSFERYKQMLTAFQMHWEQIATRPALIKKMQSSAMMLALSHDERHEEAQITLEKAQDVVIVDNVILFNQFKSLIKTAPQVTSIEKLYQDLHSPLLSRIVLETINVAAPIQNEELRINLEERIKERLTLFLESTSRELAVRSSKVSKFRVQLTSHIEISRRLPSTPVVKSKGTAVILPNDPWTIWLQPPLVWFDVGTALARVVLKKPEPESVLVLESQLKESLESLQSKGYNVTRLLQRQQEMVEAEQLKVRQQEEARVARERVEAEQQNSAIAVARQAQPSVGFDQETPGKQVDTAKDPQQGQHEGVPVGAADPPPVQLKPQAPAQSSPETKSRPQQVRGIKDAIGSFWRSGTRTRGENNVDQMQQQVVQQNEVQQQTQQLTRRPGEQPEAMPTNPITSMSTLAQGVAQSRAFNSDRHTAPLHIDRPPSIGTDNCKTAKINDLRLAATRSDGNKVFVNRQGPNLTDAQKHLSGEFAGVLQRCTETYGIAWSAVSIFVDSVETIAFNSNGSLFFNLNVYEHMLNWPIERQFDYWFVVTAHELAHNFAADHGSAHSFYAESYVQMYMDQARRIIERR